MNNLLTENSNWENTRNIVYSICFDEQLKKCKNCGKEMKYSQGKRHNYCSKKCAGNSIEVREKIKHTWMNNYGCENPAQSKEIQKKIKQTNLEKYGTEYPSQNKEIQNKVKQTCIERYGCENPFQNENIKNKIKQTNLERYGCINPFQNEEVQEKTKLTNLERYGCEHPMQNKNIQEKTKQTCLERLGCEYPLQNKEVQEKTKQTCLERLGCEHPAQNENVKEKTKLTNIEKYNCESPFQIKEVKEKVKQTHYDNSYDNFILSFIKYGITPLFPKEEYTGYDKTYRWKCKCGNIFESRIYPTSHVEECPYLPHCWECYPRLSGESKSELELLDFVKQYFPNAHKDNELIKPKELDIVIDELNLAIEYNGDYWHSAEFYLEHHDNLDEYYNYHLNKVLEANKKGYRLIHISESDWINNPENIKKKLINIYQNKENLSLTEDIIKLDRSWYNNIEIPGYKLVEELPPEIVNRNGFNVENCGYLVYKKIN